jgi:hypothetical protein
MAGLIGVPLSHYWLMAQVEPFYTSIYCFLWWSYIFVADLAVYKLRGTSLLRDRPRELLFLTIASVPVWMLFEAVNLRMQNWYYVMVPTSLSWGALFLVLAFGTVLPGIFETMELVVGVIEKTTRSGRIAGQPFTIGLTNVRVQFGIGIAMLALVLLFPEQWFCMAWGFAFFLTEPICYWKYRREQDHVGRSLLGQLAAGDNTRLVALLVAGVVTGGLWEAWNITARTKWIYSVPYFDEVKLGEMPVLGFLGFPPFALECYALVNFLTLLRGGRNWEKSQRGMKAAGEPGVANKEPALSVMQWAVAAGFVLLGMLLILSGAAHRTVASADLPLDYVFRRELGDAGTAALHQRKAARGHEFLKLAERPPEIAPNVYHRMRRLVTLSECKGMGIRNAMALESLHITDLRQLAEQNPVELATSLRLCGRKVRDEETKVWIHDAKQKGMNQGESAQR